MNIYSSWQTKRALFVSYALLGVMMFLCAVPLPKIVPDEAAAEGNAAQDPSIAISFSGTINLTPSAGGVLDSKSTTIETNTSNYTGCNLYLSSTSNQMKLVGGDSSDVIDSLSSVTSPESSDFVNKWGYKLSGATNYSPIPTSQTLIAGSSSASSSSYTLDFAAKAGETKAQGAYVGSLTATALVNPSKVYSITYNKNTSDNVDNMPSNIAQTTTTSTSVTLSNNTPTRTNYDFISWCSVAVADGATCSGTTYNPGSSIVLDTSSANQINVYAVWKTSNRTVTIVPNNSSYGSVSQSTQVAAHGTAISTSGNTLTIGSTTITATPATQTTQYTYSFSSWSNDCGSTLTADCTITANFSRSVRNYTVTFKASPSSYGSLSESSISVPYGSLVSFSSNVATVGTTAVTATPSDVTGYTTSFADWTTSSCTLKVTSNCTITASFTRTANTYTINFATNSGYLLVHPLEDATYTGHNETINYNATNKTYELVTTSDVAYATSHAKAYLTAGTTYYIHMDISSTNSGYVRVYYAPYEAYAEPGINIYNGDTESFVAPTTGWYDFRLDNHFGTTATVSNFWVSTVENPYPSITKAYDEEFTIATPTSNGYTFTGWTITGMDSGITHYYGTDSTHYMTTTSTSVTTTSPMTWFKNLRATSGTVTFTANYAPGVSYRTFQEVGNLSSTKKSQLLNNLPTNAQYRMIDVRDGKLYWVSKLADGNLWMTQNLDLDLLLNMVFYPSNTDLHNWSQWRIDGTLDRATYATGNTTWDYLYTVSESYDPGNNYYPNGTGSLTAATDFSVEDERWHYHQGNYYNWYSIAPAVDVRAMSTGQEAPDSLCPAGWRLPIGGISSSSKSWNYLISSASLTGASAVMSPTYLVRSGGFWIGAYYGGGTGYYWTSTAGNPSNGVPYAMYLASSVVQPNNGALQAVGGGSVRCVMR